MNRFRLKRWAAFAVASGVWTFAACDKSDPATPVPVDFGHDYLPLEVGAWIDYRVDSTVYDEFNQSVTTYTFYHREEVVETYEDLEGRTVYRLERQRKPEEDDTYSVIGSFELLMNDVRAEKNEGGYRTVPLVFPPHEGDRWDGNAFNSMEPREYEYLYVDRSETLNTLGFEKSLRVIQLNDTDNFVIREYAEERYARDVGLIYQEQMKIETQFGVDSGLHLVREVINWSGNEGGP